MEQVGSNNLKERLLQADSGSEGPKPGRSHARRQAPVLKYRASTVIVSAFTSGLAYCGSNSILYMFMRNYLGFSDGDAESFSNAFLTLVALSGIAGAIYSDIYAGAFKVQWQASIVWTVGAVMLFFLTLNDFSQGIKLVVAAIAWALLAFGLGSMMPSQAAFVGQQLAGPDPVKLSTYYAVYYTASNFGNFAGETALPALRVYSSFYVIFSIVAAVGLATVLAFMLGRPYCRIQAPLPSEVPRLLSLRSRMNWSVLLSLEAVWWPLIVFWSLYYQQNNTWVSQTTQMDMTIIGNIPDALPAFNDGLVCIFVPILDRYIFPAILKKRPGSLTPLRKIGAGIFCTALSFVCVALVQTAIENSAALISVGWQVPQYIFISLAEALVVVTGLDFAFSQCPSSMHSVVQALWATNQALGTTLIAVLSSSGALPDQFSSGTFYALSVAMAVCLLAHIWASRRYVYANFFQAESSAAMSLEALPGASAASTQSSTAPSVPFTEQANDITTEIDVVANILKPALIYQVDRQLFAGFKHHDGIFSSAILSRTDRCVDAIDASIRTAAARNGKVLFLFSGCGTSGRYAFQCARSFQDAVFKCSSSAASTVAFDFTIAGGDISIVASQELPEDDPAAGQRDMAAAVARHSPTHVVFFGITCGLSAPYVAGQISATMQDPDFYTSVLIGFNYPEMARNVPVEGWDKTCHAVFNQLARQSQADSVSHFLLNPIIGPEAITGSSRMKGGSMTKMLLDTVCACSLKRSGVLGSAASLVPRPSANVLNRLRLHRLADMVENQGAAVDVVCMMALYQEVLDSINCASVHASVASVLDITQRSDHVYILGCGSLAVVGLIDLSEMPDTYGAPFDEMRGFACGGWQSMLSAGSPIPTVTSPDVPVFMGQISSDDFLKDILPNLSPADCVIFLSSSPNIDENARNVSEAEHVLQATLASKASRSFSVVVMDFVDSVNSNRGSYGGAVDVSVQIKLPYSHALSYGHLLPRPLLPTYVEMACKWLLNCITTNTQVGKGVVVGNTMVNMQVANDKLFHRCIRIIQNLAGGGANGDVAKLSLVRSIWNEDDSAKLPALLCLPTSDHVKHSIGTKKKFVISKAILLASSGNTMSVSDAENILKSEKIVRKAIASVSKNASYSLPVISSSSATTPVSVATPSEASFFCGIIEGFYGEPWKVEARFDMISRLNAWTQFRRECANVRPSYMYGPKDDRKHRDVWRELYSEAELRDLSSLVRHCECNAVTFIFALSPGLDIRFSKTEDFDLIVAKFSQLNSIGVTAFALFFDDLPNGGDLSSEDSKHFKSVAHAQATVTNSVHSWLQRTLGKGSTLCFCPTEYCASLCEPNLETSPYLRVLASTLSPNVHLFWTGDSIISETVSYCSISKLAAIFSPSRPDVAARRIILWDNLYANDYDINRAYMGCYQGRSLELCSRISGIMINPNCNLHINFMPMRSVCRFVECGVKQTAYDVPECRSTCVSEWTPLFDGPVTTENVLLISDLLHLPYKMGELGCEYVLLLAQVFGDAPGRSQCEGKVARLQELSRLVVESFDRLVQCRNRSIVFALLDRFWGIKEEANLHLEMIAHVQRGDAVEEFSLIKYFAPHTYRGGWLSACRHVISMHPLNGTFSVNPDAVRSHSTACPPFQLECFREELREGMYRICVLTGDSGADGTHLYPNDWQALGRRWVGPYLDLEPGLSFALVDGAEVVGYVLASADTEHMYRALRTWYFPRLAAHFPDPAVEDCSRLSESERDMCAEYHRPSLSLPTAVSVAHYPAHLHIDLAARAQRKGCGTVMINLITSILIRRGCRGVFLEMCDKPGNCCLRKLTRPVAQVEQKHRCPSVLRKNRVGQEGSSRLRDALES